MEMLEYCIKLGIGLDDANIGGDTPLIVATKHGHFELIKKVAYL
jgi:ankyrin repeat protein